MRNPPSRQRYDKDNPRVSFRLTKSLRERVDRVKGDLTYPQVTRMIIKRSLDTLDALEKANGVIQSLESENERLQREIEALKAQLARIIPPPMR